MGKRRGLGISRGIKRLSADYNTYVAPVVKTYNKMLSGQNPFPPKKTIRTNVLQPTNPPPGQTGSGWLEQGSDEAPPISSNVRTSGFGTVSTKHPTLTVSLPPQRGMGFKAPGPPFPVKCPPVSVQFAFDLISQLNKRNYARMVFRDYDFFAGRKLNGLVTAGYRPSVAGSRTLSPNSLPREIGPDGNKYTISTPVRDGGMYSSTGVRQLEHKDDLLLPCVTLLDLEVASWNYNPFKFCSFNYFNDRINTLQSSSDANLTALEVFKDWEPLDRPNVEVSDAAVLVTQSPYDIIPNVSSTFGTQTRKPQNFMANLGPGSVVFHFQNRFNTAADIDVVVVKRTLNQGNFINDGVKHVLNGWEDQLKAAYLKQQKEGFNHSHSGFEGEVPVDDDILINPSVPFLKICNKTRDRPWRCAKLSTERFRLSAGGTKTVKLKLPPIAYDPYVNRRWAWGGSSATQPLPDSETPSYWFNYHAYGVYVSIQGVMMPVFPVVTTVATSTVPASITRASLTPVDTQACAASVLVHGEYIEHPLPCLSVSPTSVPNNNDELFDVTVSTANAKLLSGYVANPPIPTSTGPVVTQTGHSELGA